MSEASANNLSDKTNMHILVRENSPSFYQQGESRQRGDLFEDTLPIQTAGIAGSRGRQGQGQSLDWGRWNQHSAGSDHNTALGRSDPQLPHSFTEVLLRRSSGRVALTAGSSHTGASCMSSGASQPNTLNRGKRNTWDLRPQH